MWPTGCLSLGVGSHPSRGGFGASSGRRPLPRPGWLRTPQGGPLQVRKEEPQQVASMPQVSLLSEENDPPKKKKKKKGRSRNALNSSGTGRPLCSLACWARGKGQLQPHGIVQKLLWLPGTSHITRKRRTHNVPHHPRHSPSTRSLIDTLGDCQRTRGLPAFCSPSVLPWTASLPKTVPVSQPLAGGHHLASSRRPGCRAGSRSVTSPFPGGTETRTYSPFTFRGLYDKSLLEELTETKATDLPVWRE